VETAAAIMQSCTGHVKRKVGANSRRKARAAEPSGEEGGRLCGEARPGKRPLVPAIGHHSSAPFRTERRLGLLLAALESLERVTDPGLNRSPRCGIAQDVLGVRCGELYHS